MEEKDILVSVVIPTFSRNITLDRAIQSVLNQTHQNLEILVIDDNPANSEWRNSTEVLMKKYQDNPKVRYIQNTKNLGGSGARNEGIKASKADYIAFLDDDDEYFPEKVEKQLHCFLTSKQERLALVFCDALMTFDNNEFICYVKPRYKGCCLYEAMVNNCLAATSQWMASKEALQDVGMFTIVPNKQDSTLILKLLEAGYEVECVPEVLSKYCNYEGTRISGYTVKNLNGELEYKKKCEKLYDRLTPEQIKEVEYSFASILFPQYKWLKMSDDAKQSFIFMIKIHPVKTIIKFMINKFRELKHYNNLR